MKKLFFTLALALVATVQTFALTRSRAMEEAAFLTDKMIYELGLSPMQTDDVYEINYDYFTQVGYSSGLNAHAAQIRMNKLFFVLTPNQYRMCESIIYFLNPAYVQGGRFYFRIYTHYESGIFYFDRPRVYRDYRGSYLHDVNHYDGRRPTGFYYHNGVMSTEPRPMHPGPGQPGGPARPNHPGGAQPGQGYHIGGNNVQPGGATPPPANRVVNPANPNGGQRTGGVTSNRGNGGNANGNARPANGGNNSRPTNANAGNTPKPTNADNNQKPTNNGNAGNNGGNDGNRRTFGRDNNGGSRPANNATPATPARPTNTTGNTTPLSTRGNSNSSGNANASRTPTNTSSSSSTTNNSSSTTNNQSGSSSRYSGGSTGRRGR